MHHIQTFIEKKKKRKKKVLSYILVITMIVNEFIITIGFGGRGAPSIRGRVLFCSNNAAVRGLIEGAV